MLSNYKSSAIQYNNHSLLELVMKSSMQRYCCEKECFSQPTAQVDGIACTRCENFSFCRCRCKSFKQETPTLEVLKVYKTRWFFTCCSEMCSKFHADRIMYPCHKCKTVNQKTFCECVLKTCKNRKDWSS